jgi:hypothetical protein
MATADPEAPASVPTIVVLPQQSQAEAGMWLGLAAALIALAAVGWIARRRSREVQSAASEETGLRRLARLFYSAATFGTVLAMALLPEFILREGFAASEIPMTLIGMLVMTLIGMLIFGIVQFWLSLGEPIRERRWLVRAMLSFNLMILACLALIAGLGGDPLRVVDPVVLPVFAAATAAGLVWWAWLPSPRTDIAARFE